MKIGDIIELDSISWIVIEIREENIALTSLDSDLEESIYISR